MSIVYDNSKDSFEIIKDNYFNKNFGSLSKSEIDLLMFKFYLEDLIDKNRNTDGTVNYSMISDYKIAKELGITPQRVRNLKIKTELVFPRPDFNWKNSLRCVLENKNAIKIENNSIKINIPDPNLFLAIQDSIEDNGSYVDIHLNSKILSVRIEDFMSLFELVGTEEECKKISEIIENKYKEIDSNCNNKLSKAKMISEIAKNSADTISDIISWFSPVQTISKSVGNIIYKILEFCKNDYLININ